MNICFVIFRNRKITRPPITVLVALSSSYQVLLSCPGSNYLFTTRSSVNIATSSSTTVSGDKEHVVTTHVPTLRENTQKL